MTTAMQHPSYALEDRYGARNYAPLPVMLERGKACGCSTPMAGGTWT